jgi:hypothetical protein
MTPPIVKICHPRDCYLRAVPKSYSSNPRGGKYFPDAATMPLTITPSIKTALKNPGW